MGDPQDSTEILLQKARDRRARNAEATFQKRERTGPEKLCVATPATMAQNIASGISSATQPQKTYTMTSGFKNVPTRGVAGGVKGAKANQLQEAKAVPLTEIEDDFECLQEKMRNRFKTSNQEMKENLLSPGSPSPGHKRTFFDNPNSKTPLSPNQQNILASPSKKFFPDVKVDASDEPIPPIRTISKHGNADHTKAPQVTSALTISSPMQKDNCNSADCEVATQSRKYQPVKTNASFRSRASPVMGDNPNFHKTNTPTSPARGLKTVPSISIRPNSVVSRALAKLENKNLDDSDIIEPSEKGSSGESTIETAAVEPAAVESAVVEASNKVRTPNKPNTTAEDSMFIRNNMAQIQSDLSEMRNDVIAEEDKEEEEEEKGQEEEEHQQDEKENDTSDENLEDLCDEVMPDVADEDHAAKDIAGEVPADTQNREDTVYEEAPYCDNTAEEGMGDKVDSIEELCDDVMPSPSRESCDQTEDSEWLDLSSEQTSPGSKSVRGNTSLKRDADCLTESVFSSVESFISCDLTPAAKKDCKDEVRKALSPSRGVTPTVKKLRRSMSVSDLPKSPSRFVRMDALRSSSSSLKAPRSVAQSDDTSSIGSQESEGKRSKTNTYKGPLEEGTLELRPPFDQVKVLEQGIMVQNEVEAQASQLLEHCQYGLEQVEAEKLQLIAGLKKDMWKYHLTELKNDNQMFTNSELPKGRLQIKDVSLLLRQDYLVNQVIDNKVNQATFLAVKVSPYRLMTTNIATSQCNIHGTNLSISDTIVIENLPPDYRLTLEVYCMSYNMMNNSTPAKKKKLDSAGNKPSNTPKRLLQSAMSRIGSQKSKSEKAFTSSMEVYNKGVGSPNSQKGSWSPNSVAAANKAGSKFVLAGSLALTIKDVKKSQFRLRKAPFHSPFEGTINLAMSAKEAITSQPPSHKGFLTIFQEESGLGAWNRRWCSVQDNKIYYWLYPEDEVNQNKEPHGEIDLRKCKNEQVSIASRLDCARPNTFVLILLTAAQPGDRTSIITESNGKTTQTKYMLAADSKEERKQWMEVLNKCLQSIHSWNH